MNDFESQLKAASEQKDRPQINRNLWLNIKDEVTRTHRLTIRKNRIMTWSTAAVIFVLLGVGFLLNRSGVDQDRFVLEKYGLADQNFPQQVALQLEALKGSRIPGDQMAHFDALRSQLHFLDQQYEHYLDYIKKHGYQEYIGKQIQNYYEVKIELLENIQQEIEKLNKKRNEYDNNTSNVEWDI